MRRVMRGIPVKRPAREACTGFLRIMSRIGADAFEHFRRATWRREPQHRSGLKEFATLAVDKCGQAAVIYAAKPWTGPALLILDFDVQPLSGSLLADIGVRAREFAEQCRARAYLMMIPEPMLLHAQAVGLPAEAIPAHIKPEELLLSSAALGGGSEIVRACERRRRQARSVGLLTSGPAPMLMIRFGPLRY
jgi:hypothetical protein